MSEKAIGGCQLTLSSDILVKVRELFSAAAMEHARSTRSCFFLGGAAVKRMLRTVLAVSVIVLLSAGLALAAQWAENGIPVCTAAGSQDTIAMVPDGAGGSIIVWQDFRAGNWDIYAQRIDAWGRALWATSGIPVTVSAGAQQYPQIVSDGAGGAIVLYVDRPGVLDHIYAQRFDGDGDTVWPSAVQVCTVADSVFRIDPIHMSPDGMGGALIAWQDLRVDTLDIDIYAQRLLAGGTIAWAANGVAVCSAEGSQVAPQLVSDGTGGAIVVWADMRSGVDSDVYAQRVDAGGLVQWAANGVAVSVAAGGQNEAQLVADGVNGAIIAWCDETADEIYAQRLTSEGVALWGANGLAVCTAPGSKADPKIVPDGAGGAIIAWADARTVEWDVYAQRVDANGVAKWLVGGVRAARSPARWPAHEIAPNGVGGVIVTWGQGFPSDIYAQMLEPLAGSAQWTLDGVPVCTAANDQTAPAIATDGEGGALIAWVDSRAGEEDIYSQRIERNGYWGYPAPEIFAVRDVPGDQGGKINLAWNASRLDPWPNQAILNYSIWMAINPTAAAALIENGATIVTDPAEVTDRGARAIRVALAGDRTFYWKLIGYLYAAYLENYSEQIQTLFDSTAVCTEYHYFQVIANASGTKGYWISAPDSGYSVDNLAPMTPCCLAGRQLGDDLEITWHPNSEPDLAYYALFRGPTEDFVPQDPILTSTDTTAVDTSWSSSSNTFYYKLVAYDIHGNASAAALLRPNTIVATLLQSFSHSLGAAGIRIEWRLAECDPAAVFTVSRAEAPGTAFVEITDAAVEREGLAFAFVDKSFEKGSRYRYRVEVTDNGTRHVLFETEAINAPIVPLTLYQNLPNPFNPSTVITYYVPETCRVTLEIYDVSGRAVARLVDADEKAGVHEARWNGTDSSGGKVGSGVYFYRLRAGKDTMTRKMVLMR
jgi:hypothetical protein